MEFIQQLHKCGSFVFNKYAELLTVIGYIGCESFLRKVRDVILDLKKKNPNLIYGKNIGNILAKTSTSC